MACFAQLAAARRYVRPEVDDSGVFEALAARHPVIEWHMEQASEGRFVPNSIYLDTEGPSLLLLTGPNMGGKSRIFARPHFWSSWRRWDVLFRRSGCDWAWWTAFIRASGPATMSRRAVPHLWWR